MKAIIFFNNLVIGYAVLHVSDESMGCVSGDFSPNDNYCKYVQKSVWELEDKNRPDYKKWNSLNINVQLENGCFLHPIGGYTFEDAEELPSEPKRIHVAGLFRHVIEDFFLSHPPKTFVTEPWATITIDQKLMFERELQKEIKSKRVSLFWPGKPVNHVLSGFKCSAVCRNTQADDVLFSIYDNRGLDKKFALVHLTFSGATEKNPSFPLTTLYESFEDFKLKRMLPDNINC